MDLILDHEVVTPGGVYRLTVSRQELFDVYPGMVQYTLTVNQGGTVLARFGTNSYEYPPTLSLNAEEVILKNAGKWEDELRSDPEKFLAVEGIPALKNHRAEMTDVVVIQGSPRADGNCSILAGLFVYAVLERNRTVQVIYPHDLNIHACIGCYQCYNTGTCTFDDDMPGIIDTIRHASLVIVCTPVYTNSVPGSLKILIDRFQAYHAELTISQRRPEEKKGLIVSVAGRKGHSNFVCVTSVLKAFMRNIGIRPSGEVLIDELDRIRDVRNVPDLKDRIGRLIRKLS